MLRPRGVSDTPPCVVPSMQRLCMSYAKGSAQLAIAAGTSPDALTTAVAGLGYRAAFADASDAPPKGGLFDRVRDWVGGDDKASHNGGWHIAAIGIGGAEGRRTRRAGGVDRAWHQRRIPAASAALAGLHLGRGGGADLTLSSACAGGHTGRIDGRRVHRRPLGRRGRSAGRTVLPAPAPGAGNPGVSEQPMNPAVIFRRRLHAISRVVCTARNTVRQRPSVFSQYIDNRAIGSTASGITLPNQPTQYLLHSGQIRDFSLDQGHLARGQRPSLVTCAR